MQFKDGCDISIDYINIFRFSSTYFCPYCCHWFPFSQKSFAENSTQLRLVLAEWYPEFRSYFFPNISEWKAAKDTIELGQINVTQLFADAAHTIQVIR